MPPRRPHGLANAMTEDAEQRVRDLAPTWRRIACVIVAIRHELYSDIVRLI